MPDHEEAVREAREALIRVSAPWDQQDLIWLTHLETFANVIRASERAKYAALVEAATKAIEDCGWAEYMIDGADCYRHGVDPVTETGCVWRAALAALQSKEGTNE